MLGFHRPLSEALKKTRSVIKHPSKHSYRYRKRRGELNVYNPSGAIYIGNDSRWKHLIEAWGVLLAEIKAQIIRWLACDNLFYIRKVCRFELSFCNPAT